MGVVEARDLAALVRTSEVEEVAAAILALRGVDLDGDRGADGQGAAKLPCVGPNRELNDPRAALQRGREKLEELRAGHDLQVDDAIAGPDREVVHENS